MKLDKNGKPKDIRTTQEVVHDTLKRNGIKPDTWEAFEFMIQRAADGYGYTPKKQPIGFNTDVKPEPELPRWYGKGDPPPGYV